MKCRRAFDADLLAVLRGESGDLEFLAHYPACRDCASELRVWGELDQMLRAGVPTEAAHPTEESLLAFADAPATLSAVTRGAVERHVAVCRVCADEVGSLQRFDPGRLEAAASAPAVADVASRAGATVRAASTPEPAPHPGWFGRVVWHPAFAYALVLALLAPLVRSQFERFSTRASRSGPVVAERFPGPEVDGAAPAPAAAPVAGAGAPDDSPADTPASAAPAVVLPAAKVAAAPPQETRAKRVPAQSTLARQLASRDAVESTREAEAPRADEALAARAPLAGHLEDRAAPGARLTGNTAPPLVLEVSSGVHPVIELAAAKRGPLVRIVPSPGLGDGAVDVRVQATVGGRELTERVTPHANAIELQIPPQWLAPGEYTVTISALDAAPAHTAGARLGFSVRAPTGPSPSNAARQE